MISSQPRLSFNLMYNLEAVATGLKIFMGLALVHFPKYWLLCTVLIYTVEIGLQNERRKEVKEQKIMHM